MRWRPTEDQLLNAGLIAAFATGLVVILYLTFENDLGGSVPLLVALIAAVGLCFWLDGKIRSSLGRIVVLLAIYSLFGIAFVFFFRR